MASEPAFSVLPLTENWRLVRCNPFDAISPSDVDWTDAHHDAVVPGTVAATLLGNYDSGRHPDINYDDFDWWYECAIDMDASDYHSIVLNIEGLATISEIWLNGESIHTSRNMFRAFRLAVKDRIKPTNIISIVFRSINHDLKVKRPRGRWKTNLIAQQQLRWIRTTLLGRIPGWTPPIQPVGPWRNIEFICSQSFSMESASVYTSIEDHVGVVHVDIDLIDVNTETAIDAAKIHIYGNTYPLAIESRKTKSKIRGSIKISNITEWGPHNYGQPNLHPYTITIETENGDKVLRSDKLGFRRAQVDRSKGQLAFVLNGQNIFCRGACWSTNDIISLDGDPKKLRRILTLTRDAGGNMIRVGGTMIYESDHFYDLCDELGIMVWQDFMFANMDYPSGDETFLSDVRQEIVQQLARLKEHPCIVAFCGNSEVEQQAAMFGKTVDIWQNDFYYTEIQTLVDIALPGIPYFPSSPSEGPLPFHNSQGPSHYFGVGAYRQSFDDLNKSDVKFATECLAFANMPSDQSMKKHFGSTVPTVHSPRWKAGVPRDSSAGWDFEDIRDHYIKSLYGIEPAEVRYHDKERYIEISQTITGELMEAVFDYWRHRDSQCTGGLVWFLNDIVPGAGWGLFDSDGQPKPVYYSLKRCWASTRLSFRDRGMDGLNVVINNDENEPLRGTLRVQLLQNASKCIAESTTDILVQEWDSNELAVDQMLGHFFDTTFRHQFGPPKHDVVVATIETSGESPALVAHYMPDPRTAPAIDDADIEINCKIVGDAHQVVIRSDTFLQHVKLTSNALQFDDNFFHVPPHVDVSVPMKLVTESGQRVNGKLSARNITSSRVFTVDRSI